ncbi:unnamed protein product [Rhizophagus irregularis]|uniref:Uncharacterized protein n=1 Tax=Rhizophagus irregularis TaxID=588596 RepID=A0A2I1FUR5_9GLOM|nr:hypothetical protein RhiirA4_504788 [Rhizophagus irregularis]CAB4435882.1 unnamed protein product [Rhizophagus irregularis]
MSDKLLPLQRESVLKLLQLPGIKEKLEEKRKKYCNSTAYKEWEKAGEPFEEDKEVLSMKNEKNKAHHGANSQSVDDNAESKSVECNTGNTVKFYSYKLKNLERHTQILWPELENNKIPSHKISKPHGKVSGSANVSSFIELL